MNTPAPSSAPCASALPLGREVNYPSRYDRTLLYPIPRAAQRTELGLGSAKRLPFIGADSWSAFELSWLNPRGKPQVAIAHLVFPCETPNIIESKSLKLYLNSLNNHRFTDSAALRQCLLDDLSEAAWRGSGQQASIGVQLVEAADFGAEQLAELDGIDLDRLDVECQHYTPQDVTFDPYDAISQRNCR